MTLGEIAVVGEAVPVDVALLVGELVPVDVTPVVGDVTPLGVAGLVGAGPAVDVPSSTSACPETATMSLGPCIGAWSADCVDIDDLW